MNIKKCRELAQKARVEIGWIWLFENGFSKRVPDEVKMKIKKAKNRKNIILRLTGGRRGGPDGYKRLLIAVLVAQIKDYMSIVKIKAKTAKYYLFDDSIKVRNNVFSFNSICSYIGLDSNRLRKQLKLMKSMETKERNKWLSRQ